MQNSSIKLQQFLARCGISSRRQAEELISQGKISVDGKPAHIGQRINPEKQVVTYKGKIVRSGNEFAYYLVNKPVGVVTTTKDDLGRKTVLELLPLVSGRLFPVGRLDVDSQGLVLVTNDGEIADILTHPRYQITRTYHATVEGHPTEAALNHLRRGVRLTEGYTNECTAEIMHRNNATTKVAITIDQGWNRQVRRMLERVGYPVLNLTRVSHGPFVLGNLPSGSAKKIEFSANDRNELLSKKVSNSR